LAPWIQRRCLRPWHRVFEEYDYTRNHRGRKVNFDLGKAFLRERSSFDERILLGTARTHLTTTPNALTPQDGPLLPSNPASPAPSMLHRVFFGPDGLRAGWSLLIFVALMASLGFTVNFTLHKLGVRRPDPAAELTPLRGILGEGASFLLVLFVTWVMSKIERRSQAVYGLADERRLPRFLAGLGWGFVCLSVLVGSLIQTGFLIVDRRLLFAGDIFRYGAAWFIGFLMVGLLEEYLTRGYVQYTLTRGLAGLYERWFKTRHSAALGFWTAAIAFSFLFGLGHGSNPGESPIGLVSAGLAGIVFCLSLWRTGSLWWAIGFHTSWDWSQSFLYGVADSGLMVQHHLFATHPVGRPILSGGATGPEGSSFIFGIFALIVLIIFFTLPRGKGYAANLPGNRADR
jgi:membrane protease YdiL (CAAX protease family)